MCLCAFFVAIGYVKALDLKSANFILRDPLSVVQGGYSTSTNFKFFSSTGQTAIGQISSANFIYRSGFLYFSAVTSPVVSAIAGNAQVALSWTAASAELGLTISGYNIGESTISGGPYNISGVGNVLTSNRTGLTNGTTYYFIVRVLDALGNVIATSTEVAAQPVNPGGGGIPSPPTPSGITPPPSSAPYFPSIFNTYAIFNGSAYPGSTVILLKDGLVADTVKAEENGNFSLKFSGASPGRYLFGIYAIDRAGNQSAPVTLLTNVLDGKTTLVEGVFIGPTLNADKSEVKFGDRINFYGETAPFSEITLFMSGVENIIVKTIANENGRYSYSFGTESMQIGEYSVRAKAYKAGITSGFSRVIRLEVGEKTIIISPRKQTCVIADINCDGKVDLTDFSMMLFWFEQSNPPKSVDFDKNGIVDLSDFSILIYYWTG